jgi:hypothetical protein
MNKKKLSLRRQNIRNLSGHELSGVGGGFQTYFCLATRTFTCEDVTTGGGGGGGTLPGTVYPCIPKVILV